MKTKPILFSGPMVRAILDGRKTQTRRVVKPQPKDTDSGWTTLRYFGGGLAIECGPDYPDDASDRRECPYGQPGDLLWVQETWRVGAWRDGMVDQSIRGECPVWGQDDRVALDYAADDHSRREWLHVPDAEQHTRLVAQSIEDAMQAGFAAGDDIRWSPGESPCRWRRSTHMPRWASRITLRITDVRVERVQEITTKDCHAEGIERSPYRRIDGLDEEVHAFRELWDSLNADRGYPWEANPWIWRVEFESINENVDAVVAREAA